MCNENEKINRYGKRFCDYDYKTQQEFVKTAQLNNPKVTNLLFASLGKYYKSYAYRHLKIGSDVEDVIQDALLNMYKYFKKSQPPEKFGKVATIHLKWAYVNYCKKFYKRNKYNVLLDERYVGISDKILKQPDYIAENNEIIAKLQTAINNLPEKSRQMFNLYLINNFTGKQTCEILKISPSTMRRYINRARWALIRKYPELKVAV